MFGKNAKQSKSSKCSKTAKSNVEASKEAKGCDSRTTKNSSRQFSSRDEKEGNQLGAFFFVCECGKRNLTRLCQIVRLAPKKAPSAASIFFAIMQKNRRAFRASKIKSAI